MLCNISNIQKKQQLLVLKYLNCIPFKTTLPSPLIGIILLTTEVMKQITIFDDDENILELSKFILEQKGYSVSTFENCDAIIEKLEKSKPDVILMDNWIPDMGGILATRMIKEHETFRHIPVIYFSANNDIKLLAEHAGADAYLAKPFNITELENIVAEMIAATSNQTT